MLAERASDGRSIRRSRVRLTAQDVDAAFEEAEAAGGAVAEEEDSVGGVAGGEVEADFGVAGVEPEGRMPEERVGLQALLVLWSVDDGVPSAFT